MSDLERLRQVGAGAAQAYERQCALTSALEELHLEQHQRLQELSATFVIETIPIVAELAALNGENCASIMRVGHSDYRRPIGNLEFGCRPEWLTGVCKIVFAHCESAGYKPILKYRTDYPSAWFEIWISW